jgi:Holliday junction resolvasome RuvABC DNA-binding subunit
MKKISETIPHGETGTGGMTIHDAISALVSLGFSENASRDAVNKAARAPDTPSVQGLIKAALVTLKER